LDGPAGDEAIAALVSADIVVDRLPLSFRHPLVRAAIYDDIGAAARADGHREAAQILAAQGSDPERVAAHLLRCEPAGRLEVVELLVDAAHAAAARAASDSVTRYLRRTLDEPAPPGRPGELLHRLGRAELARDLANVLVYTGQSERADRLLDDAIAGLGDRDPDLSMRLQTMWGEIDDQADTARLAALREQAERDLPGARPLRVYLGFRAAGLGENVDTAADLVERGLDGTELVATESSDSPASSMRC